MLSTRGSKKARAVSNKWQRKDMERSKHRRDIQKMEADRTREVDNITKMFLTEWLINFGTDWVEDSLIYTLDSSIAFTHAQSQGLATMRREQIEDGVLTFFPRWQYRITEKGLKFIKENDDGNVFGLNSRADGK